MNRREAHVIGTTLEGRYRIDSVMARGGMSVVYRGVDLRLDRPVAVKVMDQRFSGDASFVRRFELEARSAARLHHPSVVTVHDQGVDRSQAGDQVFLVMELVDGGTLRDLLHERGTLPPDLALSVLEPVLAALESAHRNGIVHRDIKPENILISRDGAVKVADFGLVRALADAKTTSDSVILGTVDYLAPEQVTTGETDARGDVYATGVVLYELLTGVPPFTGDTPFSTAYRHVNDRVPAPGTQITGLPPALDELVLRATRREQDQRPADAGVLLRELRETRAALGLSAVTVPGVAPAAPAPDAGGGRATVGEPDVETAAHGVDGIGRDAGPSADLDAPTIRTVLPPRGGPGGGPGAPAGTPAGAGAGPRATRALSRSELPQPEQESPAPVHAARAGGVGGDRGERGRRGRRGRAGRDGRGGGGGLFALTSKRMIALVVVLVLGLLLWWWNSSQWTSVPSLAGMESERAESALHNADLEVRLDPTPHDEIEAGQVIESVPDEGRRLRRGSEVRLRVSTGRPTVPEIAAGATREEALAQIEEAGLEPVVDEELAEFSTEVEEGAVVRVDPEVGTALPIDGEVTVILSKGPPPVPVPDVAGLSRDDAFNTLREQGFEPVELEAEFSEDLDGGHVIRTDPAAETMIAQPGAQVGVVLSNAVIAPYVTGDTLSEAREAIRRLGLEIEVNQLFGGDNARVLGQFPSSGARLRPGDTITVNTL
ncbi:serine/threonine-protein kinase [Actinoalloteichus hoggarensis]|uniref:Stk1 family PASTA domain-containing Ser/Thr kinase n=1 Tax=Actinoalloteichus hoggarensis TaxID=1470176 RepID=UPI00179420A5|nr:serine/threonine-protein kinase [Actinoalloteichus hoggarensis]